MVKNWKKTKKTPISKTAQIHPLSSFLFNIIFNVLAITFEEEEKKEFTLEKKKGKNSDFFADGVVLYIENSKEDIKKKKTFQK